MQTVYSILDSKAKAWWYHKDLRKAGNVTEARQRERESIRSNVRTVREAILFNVSPAGFVVHCAAKRTENSTTRSKLSGYGDGSEYSEPLLRCRPEVPQVDTRTMDESTHIRFAISGPMMSEDQEDNPREDGSFGGMSYVSIPTYLAIAEGLGAKVHWGRFEAEKKAAQEKAAATIAKLSN